MEKYTYFITLALIAEIIGTISGFGSSILFVPLASIFFDFKTVLGITAVFHVFSNLSKIALFKKGIDYQIAIRLGIPAVIFVIIGAWLTTIIDIKYIEIGVNSVILALAFYLLLNFDATLEKTYTNMYLGGAISGFLAGLVGTGGAVRGLTLSAFGLSKDFFVATSALIDLGVDFSRAIVYINNGYFEYQYLVLIPFLIAISFLGSFIGKIALKFTSETIFRYLVLALVLAVSVFQIWKLLNK